MKIYAIISQKGGSGKTTVAVNLAVAAERAGLASAIIDLDPQASANVWKDIRGNDAPYVTPSPPARLPQMIETARKGGAGVVILDTAPHSESAALAAARTADVIVIPCRPAIFDLRAITNSLDLANIAKKPAVIVLNAVRPRGVATEQARNALQELGVTICPHVLTNRSAYQDSLTAGQSAQEYEPHGKAAQEVTDFYSWLTKAVIK